MIVSGNYRRAEPADQVALVDAWQDPKIPMRQYESVVRGELHRFAWGGVVPPYRLLVNLLRGVKGKTLLDVGASSGYYSEVLKIAGLDLKYTGLDYSPYYRDFAQELYPGIHFKVGEAQALPFDDKSFDIVLHSACIMHMPEYEKAIAEAARVARNAVIFHRTPIYTDKTPTEAFVKTAYDVPCIEFHFNEAELLGMFVKYGMTVVTSADVFMDGTFGHRSYLLRV